MVQYLQTNPSVTLIGPSEYLASATVASNVQLPDETSVVSDESGATLFIREALRDITEMKAMEDELNEHRYYLERKVEQRTEQLMKRLALLESCNATLCDKLALAHKEIAALKQRSEHPLAKKDIKPNERAAKFCVTNSQTQKLPGLNMQYKCGGHAAAT
ncbi:MAG: hypothetical protein PHD43_23570 [Methylococcales bacterium]|nr:hypothetical protein [Methylococcales bacterium]